VALRGRFEERVEALEVRAVKPGYFLVDPDGKRVGKWTFAFSGDLEAAKEAAYSVFSPEGFEARGVMVDASWASKLTPIN
jgi:hypothetical protein